MNFREYKRRLRVNKLRDKADPLANALLYIIATHAGFALIAALIVINTQ